MNNQTPKSAPWQRAPAITAAEPSTLEVLRWNLSAGDAVLLVCCAVLGLLAAIAERVSRRDE